MSLFGRKRASTVAEAIGPLTQILGDLKGVATRRRELAAHKTSMAERLTAQAATDSAEAERADALIGNLNIVLQHPTTEGD